MSESLPQTVDGQIKHLVVGLNSLLEGELAVTMLIARGQQAVPYLEHFLFSEPPRTIALPRCRAIHALGELGAYSSLISYFREYEPPADAQILLAEDAVRSAAAEELLRWKEEEAFLVLLDAAKQRATSGLIYALGEFRRPESVPLLFTALEDDLCREQAKAALRKVAAAAHQYAILLVRGLTDTPLRGPYALRRCRATLQLLEEFGAGEEEWRDLREFLFQEDADVVIATAGIGFAVAPSEEHAQIVEALFRISRHLNWAQEGEAITLLDAHCTMATSNARTIAEGRIKDRERPDWLNPSWRVLRHFLGSGLEKGHYGAA